MTDRSAGPVQALAAAVERALGDRVTASVHVGGGSINQAYRMDLAGGGSAFVKTHPGGVPGMFRCEADGLAWLAEAGAVRVPRVLAVHDPPSHSTDDQRWLALEWVEPAPRAGDWDEQLGRSLAALHLAGADRFGFAADNFIAELDQPNQRADTWAEFYATRRLIPFSRLAIDRGRLPASVAAAVGEVCARLDELAGPPEPPARLHGDLWSGNALAGPGGAPWLVDPAVYGGHREVDLAMMRLFGGFGPRCFDAYHEVHPLADGHDDRVGLYQLYPLLVHVILFGGGYASTFLHTLDRYR